MSFSQLYIFLIVLPVVECGSYSFTINLSNGGTYDGSVSMNPSTYNLLVGQPVAFTLTVNMPPDYNWFWNSGSANWRNSSGRVAMLSGCGPASYDIVMWPVLNSLFVSYISRPNFKAIGEQMPDAGYVLVRNSIFSDVPQRHNWLSHRIRADFSIVWRHLLGKRTSCTTGQHHTKQFYFGIITWSERQYDSLCHKHCWSYSSSIWSRSEFLQQSIYEYDSN